MINLKAHVAVLRLQVYNPPNATPVVVEKVSEEEFIKMNSKLDRRQTLQVKQAYRLAASAFLHLKVSRGGKAGCGGAEDTGST